MSARMVTAFALGYFAAQLARPLVVLAILALTWLLIELLRPVMLLTQLLWAHEVLLAFGPAAMLSLASVGVDQWVRG